jgi:hypothetical protein
VFEHSDFPVIHHDDTSTIIPYNSSKFMLNGKYSEIFSEFVERDAKKTDEQKKRFFKIRYTLNILPSATHLNGECQGVNDLLNHLGETKELSLFDTSIVKDFYEFQWNKYAKHIHFLGFFHHLVYFLLYIFYINHIYLDKHMGDGRGEMCWSMLICLIYPLTYDAMQVYKIGLREYLSDPWNYIDQAHVWVGISNALIQRFSPNMLDPINIFFMVAVGLISFIKTMFFLRVFNSLSFLVSMLS